jgi:hypothetical protein
MKQRMATQCIELLPGETTRCYGAAVVQRLLEQRKPDALIGWQLQHAENDRSNSLNIRAAAAVSLGCLTINAYSPIALRPSSALKLTGIWVYPRTLGL